MKRKNVRTNRLGCGWVLVVVATIGSVLPAHAARPRGADPTQTAELTIQAADSTGSRHAVIVLSAPELRTARFTGDADPGRGASSPETAARTTARCAECIREGQEGARAALRNNFFALIAEVVD